MLRYITAEIIRGNGHEDWQSSLLAIFGVDYAQNLGKYKRWLCMLIPKAL